MRYDTIRQDRAQHNSNNIMISVYNLLERPTGRLLNAALTHDRTRPLQAERQRQTQIL